MPDDYESDNRSLTSYVTFRLARTQNKLNTQANHLLKVHCGLSLVEWRIIQLLRHLNGASMTKLAQEVQMDKGQLSRKIKTMIDKGLLSATQDENDHRKQSLQLTPSSRRILKKMLPVMRKRQDGLVKGIDRDRLMDFFDVLEQIDSAASERDF